ncbi:hypothetical protein KSP40_PGU001085 [Platanthera guangdongensis]|uniref:Uncharacterized protein n=1 Tax=Platanthera guangdongensis TaxID=2320717 RepID=A0ABR2M4T7_9ASPA
MAKLGEGRRGNPRGRRGGPHVSTSNAHKEPLHDPTTTHYFSTDESSDENQHSDQEAVNLSNEVLETPGIIVTNDGNAILREPDIAHPAAKMFTRDEKAPFVFGSVTANGTRSLVFGSEDVQVCREVSKGRTKKGNLWSDVVRFVLQRKKLN